MNLNEIAQQDEASQAIAPTQAQQAQFDMLLGRARQVMGASAEEWMQALSVDPASAAVHMGTQLLRSLVQASEQAGQPVDPVVLIHVGVNLAKDIAGIANHHGLVPDDQLEDFIRDVTQQSIAEYFRMDSEEGMEPEPLKAEDGTAAHESAESPTEEAQEGPEGQEEMPGAQEMDEQAEMAAQLQAIRAARSR